MLLFAIERSSSTPGAALYRGSDLLAACAFPCNHPPSANFHFPWTSAIRALFSSASPAELSAILLTIGPGSFSGIRAALSFAQGLALPFPHIRILGASTAAVIAWQHLASATPGDTCTVIGDARREYFWQAHFRREPAGLSLASCPEHCAASVFTPNPDRLSAPASRRDVLPADLCFHPPAQTSADFELLPYSTRHSAQLAFPTAEALASLYFADPSAFIENPLPIYLHAAV